MAGIAANPPSLPHVDPPATPSYQTLTGLGVGVTVVAALYFGRDILLPITVAVLLSFVLSPLVGILRRLRIPRAVAVVFSVGLALAIISGVGALLGSQMVEIAGDLPLYQTTIEKKVDVIRSATLGRIAEVASRFRGTLGQTGQISPPTASPAGEQAARPEQTVTSEKTSARHQVVARVSTSCWWFPVGCVSYSSFSGLRMNERTQRPLSVVEIA